MKTTQTKSLDSLKRWLLVLGLCGASLVVAALVVLLGDKQGVLILFGIVGIVIVTVCVINTKFGFYCTILTGFCIATLGRLLGQELPWGVIIEVMIIATFAGIILRKVGSRQPVFAGFDHPITYGYLIFTIFLLVELFNPAMDSIAGWGFTFRKFVQFLMIYFISMELFKDLKSIRYYLSFWIILATIAGAYGCYHEWFGMFEFEMNWIWSVPGRAGLYSLDNGNFRKFSLFSDPAAYGIGMAASAVAAVVLMLGTSNFRTKILLSVSAFFLFLGMAYSGTRTAFSIVPAGFVLYILMTINRKGTLIFATAGLLGFVFIIWGPIYGNPTINRIRSTFEFSDDPSMQVRDVNRRSIQPYIYSHPIGGGLATSGMQGLQYNPNHRLAGFPPDSGFIRSAVETGWIGLGLQCLLYFIILSQGSSGFYKSRHPFIRLYFLTGTIGAFLFILAQYAQVSIGQIPGCFYFYPFLAIIVRLKQINELALNRPVIPENNLSQNPVAD